MQFDVHNMHKTPVCKFNRILFWLTTKNILKKKISDQLPTPSLSKPDILILLKIELGDILKTINSYFKLYNNNF